MATREAKTPAARKPGNGTPRSEPRNPTAMVAVVAALSLAALLSPGLFGLAPGRLAGGIPRVGEIADRSYKAPSDVSILDREATEKLRRAAVEQSPVLYDFDDRRAATLNDRIRQAFGAARRETDRAPEEGGATPEEAFAQALGAGNDLPLDAVELIAKRGFPPEDEQVLVTLASGVSTRMIVNDKAELKRHEEKRVVVVRELGSGVESKLEPGATVLSLEDARTQMRNAQGPLLDNRLRRERDLLNGLAQALVVPNLNFNLRATDERRQEAEAAVKDVMISLRKGEIIVRDGVPVTERHVRILEGLAEREQTKSHIGIFFGIAAALLALFVVVWRFGLTGLLRFSHQPVDAVFLLGTLVCAALGVRIGQFLCDAAAGRLEGVPFMPDTPEAYYYVIPIATATMLVRLVHSAETSLVFAALISLIAALALGGRVEYALFAFAGSVSAARGVGRVTQRGTVLRAGLRVGLVNVVVVGALSLLRGGVGPLPAAGAMLLGFVGGALAGVLVSGLAPLVETLFAYTTDIKLIELANRDQPVLRELELRAPGTYHHCMMVGHLAERAAEAIGANALLVRVAAYYHDIGKMKRPHFFIENMRSQEGENRHDRLSPSMSARIIQAHVKDGLELGRENKLAPPILDGIAQHHGTSVVRFFLEKARGLADPEKGVTIEEHDYRYPGPKPQTREAGILMLADSVEAAARTLPDTSPARIQQLVQRIINNYFRDGQLDDCNITLRDLHRIARSFIDTLSAIRHQRIDYPLPGEGEQRKAPEAADEGVVERIEPKPKDRPERAAEEREGDLKRLGLP